MMQVYHEVYPYKTLVYFYLKARPDRKSIKGIPFVFNAIDGLRCIFISREITALTFCSISIIMSGT